MINYSVFKGARLLCNSYLKWEIRKGLNETFYRDYSFTIYYNVNERLLIYYKKYKFNKKHKFNTIRKNYSFTFTYNEIIKRGAAEHIRHELVPLLESNYFKN